MNCLGSIRSKPLYAAKVTTMMTWMMGIGMLGWVLVIALLVTLVIVLVRFVGESPARERSAERDRLEPPA